MRPSSARLRARRAEFRYIAEDAASGYGDAADRLVRALRNSGVRIEYRGWPGGEDGTRPSACRHSRDPDPAERAPRDAPTVAHLVPEHLPNVRAAIGRGPLISHTVWETDRLPSHWPALLNDVDRVIVPTEWNREVFVASGVTTPVVVVPHVACDPVPGDGGFPLGVPHDVVVFYAITRWDQRKAPQAVIRAFLEAFTADDPVALLVKTTPYAEFQGREPWGRASDLRGTTMLEVARIVRDYPRPAVVRVETGDWTPARVAGLHTRGDCYVSLAHGEGWGLGAFDAAAYGNPVVMTGWSGQLEFLDDRTGYLVDHDLEPVRSTHGSYSADQRWAVPRIDHAVELMREIAADLGAARRRAAPLRARVLHDYAPARVVAALRDAVPELEREVEPERATWRRPSGDDDRLLLVGLMTDPWRVGYDNWLEMAERYGYRYDVVGLDHVGPYVAHETKWRLLLDYCDDLPRDQLVFYVDAVDAFVCDAPAATLARYRSYGVPLVLGAEPPWDRPRQPFGFDVPDPAWSFGNAGVYVGEAGAIADALREGYELEDWARRGSVSDQGAMIRYLRLPEHRHLGTVDHRRSIVQNIGAAPVFEEYDGHRGALEVGSDPGTSSVHFYDDNGPGYNTFARLYGLPPQELQEGGRYRVPTPVVVPEPKPVPAAVASRPMPRIAHFVWGLRPRAEPFHLVHYLAIASCLELVEPDAVHLHCHHLPYGPYWDLVEPHVVVHRVEPAAAVSEYTYDPSVARYAYAHHADFVRLDVLAEHGGLYADLDTLFVDRLPERLWRAPFVIGREADVGVGDGRAPRPALSNAVLMSKPGSAFVEVWRAEIGAALDGTWANHSCLLAHELATRLPNEVHVEPQRTFHAFEPTPDGIPLMLEHPPPDLDGIVALHLAAHLWWDEDRQDRSTVHAGMIDEEWIRTSESTYATLARRFLPSR